MGNIAENVFAFAVIDVLKILVIRILR